jgi:hypothetical protein
LKQIDRQDAQQPDQRFQPIRVGELTLLHAAAGLLTFWFSSQLVAHKRPLDGANALFCSIRSTGGGTSILARVPEGGGLHLRDWLGGQTRPGQWPRPAKRFVASRSPGKLGGAIVAHVCSHRRCLSLAPAVLGQQRKCCRNLWKTRALRTCHRFLRVVEAPTVRITASLQLDGRHSARSGHAAPHGTQASTSDTERLPDQATISALSGRPETANPSNFLGGEP